MHSRGKEDASGKSRAAAFPGTYPAPSPPRDIPSPHGADGGSSRGRPEHLQAMHRPGTCSAARDAAGIEPDPRNRSTRTLFPPPPPLQPLPSSRSIPHRARHSPCFAGLEMVPPSPGRDPRLGRHSPIGGVASVCRPTSWPGPSPSRKSLNWLSAPSRVVGKMNLPRRAKGFCGASGCWVSSEVYSPPPAESTGRGAQPRLPSPRGALRAVGAVAVGAAVGGLPAALPGDPGPHLHRDAGLRAPPNVAAQLFGTTLWKARQGVSPGSARCSRTLLRDGRQTRWKNRVPRTARASPRAVPCLPSVRYSL